MPKVVPIRRTPLRRRENAPSLPWSARRGPLFFKECEDYASRIDILWSRLDLLPVHRERLAAAAGVILRADHDPRARALPVVFTHGVENGLPQVAFIEDFIEACETVEGVEDHYAEAI